MPTSLSSSPDEIGMKINQRVPLDNLKHFNRTVAGGRAAQTQRYTLERNILV